MGNTEKRDDRLTRSIIEILHSSQEELNHFIEISAALPVMRNAYRKHMLYIRDLELNQDDPDKLMKIVKRYNNCVLSDREYTSWKD